MKIRITMKDPDCLDMPIDEAVRAELKNVQGIDEQEREQLVEDRKEKIRKRLLKWFEYGEYLVVEVDLDTDTVSVSVVS